MKKIKNKTIKKIEEIEEEIITIDLKLKKLLNENEQILNENVKNYKQLRKKIQKEIKTEKIITKFEHILYKLFSELKNYFNKLTEESKRTDLKQLYEKYEQELSQLIQQEIKTFEEIKKDIILWDEKIERIKTEWLKEAKKGEESKREITQYRQIEIHEVDERLYNQIKNISPIITKLQNFNKNILKELGTINETKIEIKIPDQRLENRLVIIDTNFFKSISNISKNSQLIITKENLRGHNIVIPNKVIEEAIGIQNSNNSGLVPRKVVSYIIETINAKYKNLEYEASYVEERKLERARMLIKEHKRPTSRIFKKTADAQILIYIWRNPNKKITIITNDGDFTKWYRHKLLGEAIAISADRSFKIVA